MFPPFPRVSVDSVNSDRSKFRQHQALHETGFDNWYSPKVNTIMATIMTTRVTIDKAGRVIIPKTLRDQLHLEAGDTLELESEGDRMTLRPVRTGSALRKEQGVWVFRRGGTPITTEATAQVLETVRSGRDRANRGSRP